ncbi:MAG: DUF6496 domain-containing protein [Candidatus Cybelea sp.]
MAAKGTGGRKRAAHKKTTAKKTTAKKTTRKKTTRKTTRKYGPKASQGVERAMEEMKAGKLRSGRSGKKVTSRKQAIAIGLSEARREGGKVPKKQS